MCRSHNSHMSQPMDFFGSSPPQSQYFQTCWARLVVVTASLVSAQGLLTRERIQAILQPGAADGRGISTKCRFQGGGGGYL